MSRKEQEERQDEKQSELTYVKNIMNDVASVKTAFRNSDCGNGLEGDSDSAKCDNSDYERTESSRCEQDELLEMFREIKRDWYVFTQKICLKMFVFLSLR